MLKTLPPLTRDDYFTFNRELRRVICAARVPNFVQPNAIHYALTARKPICAASETAR